MITNDHKKYATARQWEYVLAVKEHGSILRAAEAMGVKRQVVQFALKAVKRKAAKHGLSPEHDMTQQVPEGYNVKGTSTLYKEGKPALQWVKTSIDSERQEEMMQEAIAAMCQDLPPVKKSTPPNHAAPELMAVYPLGDPHIGMLSWGEESGQDWDLDEAEKAFGFVFDRLIKTAPPCDECCIVNLGDYFHYDNMEGVTSRSGHSLDVDSRYAKMIKVGVRIMRRMIESALLIHNKVRVINATGNHDDVSSLFLNVALSNIYSNEPRVLIDDKPVPVHYVQFGAVMFGVHHGHTIKMQQMPLLMATDQPTMWGATKYRYGYTGHIHHDSMKEYSGAKIESFRTLAAKDAYATWGGYRAGQDSKCIVLHKEYGEVERHTVNLSMMP